MSLTVTYKGQSYTPIYNEQTGYYEIEITANTSGVDVARIDFEDSLGVTHTEDFDVLVYEKPQIDLSDNCFYAWIISWRDLSVKDIVQITEPNITLDEETNANSTFIVMKEVDTEFKDYVVIKRNNQIIYNGIVDRIENTDGELKYTYTCKYITNMFDQTIPLQNGYANNVYNGMCYRIDTTSQALKPYQDSTTSGSEVRLAAISNSKNSRWVVEEVGENEYRIKNADTGLYLGYGDSNTILRQMSWNEMYHSEETHNGIWTFNSLESGTFYLTTYNYYNSTRYTISPTEDSSGALVLTNNLNNRRIFRLHQDSSETIQYSGLEGFIAAEINANFVQSEDTLFNKTYIKPIVETNTPKNTTVDNVENGIYNLHTCMTNFTQLYGINYKYEFNGNTLDIDIYQGERQKQIIDTEAFNISDYQETFETNVVAKVIVLTSTDTYTLYLLNDRTTTTDATDTNRADGIVKTIYEEEYANARQAALNEFKGNSYNHNITFKWNKYIELGTPISIKTKKSIIYDTYISKVVIKDENFYEYTCGNIRIDFIDKLLKERRK